MAQGAAASVERAEGADSQSAAPDARRAPRKERTSGGKVNRRVFISHTTKDEELLAAVRTALSTATGRSAEMTYAEVLVRVLNQQLPLQLPARPVVEADADTIADTIAGLLAAVPQFDGPWGPAVGPVYLTEQVRGLLGGVSRQALADRAKRSTLLALKTRDGHTVYPAWQFTFDRQVLEGLAEVLRLFAGDEHGEVVDGWTLASWLRIPLPELDGGSVADRLRAGDVAAARQVAAHAAARWSQ